MVDMYEALVVVRLGKVVVVRLGRVVDENFLGVLLVGEFLLRG